MENNFKSSITELRYINLFTYIDYSLSQYLLSQAYGCAGIQSSVEKLTKALMLLSLACKSAGLFKEELSMKKICYSLDEDNFSLLEGVNLTSFRDEIKTLKSLLDDSIYTMVPMEVTVVTHVYDTDEKFLAYMSPEERNNYFHKVKGSYLFFCSKEEKQQSLNDPRVKFN